MKQPDKFFAVVKQWLLGPSLSQSEVDGCNAILTAMEGMPLAHTAYALATAYKETAHTMQPINEMGGDAYFFRRYDPKGQRPDIAKQLGNTHPGDGVMYHGRGFIQITGRANYAKAEARLGVPLVNSPEKALELPVAAQVMRRGFSEGWFTGKTLANYLPAIGAASHVQFTAARRIINGQDCAKEIADYAMRFQDALEAGCW